MPHDPAIADLFAALAGQRSMFIRTLRGLTDEQARLTPTVSSLNLAGLVTHLTAMERQWAGFIVDGPAAFAPIELTGNVTLADAGRLWADQFDPGQVPLAELLAQYQAACAETDAIIADCDVDACQPLPDEPWFEPGARWSVRQTILHLLAEVAQHSGHADIIREAIDGAKTMG